MWIFNELNRQDLESVIAPGLTGRRAIFRSMLFNIINKTNNEEKGILKIDYTVGQLQSLL